jgi:hypothetical protein
MLNENYEKILKLLEEKSLKNDWKYYY